MKNAHKYEKKVKKLLKGMTRVDPEQAPTDQEALAVLVESVLQTDTTKRKAAAAFESIRKEFVDFNELRVSPPKDIIECVGRTYTNMRTNADMITTVLRNIFDRTGNVSIDYMERMTKRDLRRHLGELGLSPYASGSVVLRVFGGHAIPVDETLVEVLKMDEYVHPNSDVPDVQAFLERIIKQKDALSAHEFFRAYLTRSAKALERKRKAEARAQQKAEAQARAREKAQAKAEEKKKAAAAKKTAKKPPRKTPRKPTKKTGKKAAARKKPPAKVSKKKKARKTSKPPAPRKKRPAKTRTAKKTKKVTRKRARR